MILTEEVKIKISSRNINHYRNKGYNCKVNDIVDIKIEDLCKGSHEKIKVKCDVCGVEKEMTYHSYNSNFYNCNYHYSCSKCSVNKTKKTNLEKYGVEHASQSKEIREKIKNTNLERYGVENVSQNINISNKIKETIVERYGVESYSKTEEYKEKFRNTMLERYGVEHQMYIQETKDKIKKTCLEKYGVENPIQNSDIFEKGKKTNLERYGVEYISQSKEIKEKIKKTNLERYGVEYIFQNLDMLNKSKITNLERYGVEYPLQNLEIFEKQQKSAHKSKTYKNHTYRGTYELDFLINFSDKYNIEKAESIDYIFQNKKKKYHPDFYLPYYNLIVEIKSIYTYDREKQKNETKKEASINNGYNFIFIINKDYSELLFLIG